LRFAHPPGSMWAYASSHDDELASDTSEVMEQQSKGKLWKKPTVIGVCAAFGIAAMVVIKRMPTGFHDVTETDVISLAAAKCPAGPYENCMNDACGDDKFKCADPGFKCYQKNQYWAQCQPTCDPSWIDPHDNLTWECLILNVTSEKKCAKDGDKCEGQQGCCNTDFTCYIKHDTWSNCNADCVQGPGANSYDSNSDESWTCEVHDMSCPDLDPNATGLNLAVAKLGCCQTNLCNGGPCTGGDVNKCTFYEKEVAKSAYAAAGAAPAVTTTQGTVAPA